MITEFDDYAVHQTPEPVSRPSTGDPNFYDRWFFAGHSADGRVVFEAALGLYPNRRVMDAHWVVLTGGMQHCFHGSRRAPVERGETRVGPFALEVEQPLRRVTLRLDDPASGLACEVRFAARSAPVEEPQSRLYDEDRLVMHTTRFTQFGTWDGWVAIDGRATQVSGALGVRDRSWGIRPCGEPAGGAPARAQRPPAVYWAWTPLNFADRCLHFNTFEDPNGRPTQLGATELPAHAGPDALPAGPDPAQREYERAQLEVRWKPGSRHPQGGVLALQAAAPVDRAGNAAAPGDTARIELEPLATVLTKGLGYQHPEWGHGVWKGELALGHERFRPDELDPLRPENVHVHQVVRARLSGASGSAEGVGILETLCFGPHAPSGFAGFLDGAPHRSR